jgi:hypothetical protein
LPSNSINKHLLATPTTSIDMPPSQLLAVAVVSVLLLLWRPAGAAEYTVGDDSTNGWDTGTNYNTWSQSQSFAAGDVLGQYFSPSTQPRHDLVVWCMI